MRALLWKDTRLLGNIVLLSFILTCLPLASAVFLGRTDGHWPSAHDLCYAGFFGLLLSLLSTVFLAGNAFCRERVDGSEAFLAYLPTSPLACVTSKLIVCWATVVASWAIPAAAMIAGYVFAKEPPNSSNDVHIRLLLVAAAHPAVFGVSWFFSSFMKSTGAPSLITILCFVCLSLLLNMLTGLDGRTRITILVAFEGVVGITGICLGCWLYSRRLNGMDPP